MEVKNNKDITDMVIQIICEKDKRVDCYILILYANIFVNLNSPALVFYP